MDKGILKQAYDAPQAEVFQVRIERAFLQSGKGGPLGQSTASTGYSRSFGLGGGGIEDDDEYLY
jgi:hypothetical protein